MIGEVEHCFIWHDFSDMLSSCLGTCTKNWTKLAVGWFPLFVYSCKNQGNSFLYIWHLLFCSRQNWSKLVWKFDPQKGKKRLSPFGNMSLNVTFVHDLISLLEARYVGCSEHLGWRTPKIRTCWQNAPKTLISQLYMLVKSHYIRILRKCAKSFLEVLRGQGRVNTSSTQKSCREATKKTCFPTTTPVVFSPGHGKSHAFHARASIHGPFSKAILICSLNITSGQHVVNVLFPAWKASSPWKWFC